MRCRNICIILLIFGFLNACSHFSPAPSLYEKLGGEKGIVSIVNNLTKNIGHDEQLFHYFAQSNVSRFKKSLILYLCATSDGPCQYNGDSMQQIHDGMDINERDFNHLVDLLIDAMNETGISHPIQNQLLARLVPLRKQIIYR